MSIYIPLGWLGSRARAAVLALALGLVPVATVIRAADSLTGVRLFTDAALTVPGLVGSYVDRCLQDVSDASDWRSSQVIAGTRPDPRLTFTTGSWGARASVGLTGGSDADWEAFSVQWDGFVQITQAGQRLATASDDGSRMWLDLNHDGTFGADELLVNGWGRAQGLTGGPRSAGLPPGTYRIRIQYYEAGGANELHLAASPFIPRQFVPAADNPRQVVKAIVLNYDPRVPSEGGKRLHRVFGWSDPHDMVVQFERDLEFATGGAIDIQVVEFRDLDDFPDQVDGYRPTPDDWVASWRGGGPWHRQATDLDLLVRKQQLADLVNNGAADEIWCFGPPAEVDLFGETWMAGPNAFYINGGTFPQIPFDRAVAGYGFNYERGVGEMLHNLGHRTEDSMARPYGGWQLENPTTPWEHFAANYLTPPPYGVGTAHVPANAGGHYDYGNARTVDSTAFDWANYPALTGATRPVNSGTWCFGPAADAQRDYFCWFWGMMPRNSGIAGDGRQANWFKYLWDFNSYRAGSGLFRQLEAVASTPRYIAGSNLVFTVRYYDPRGVNPATLDGSDIRVTGPNAYNRLASLSRIVASADPRRLTAWYAAAAPGGVWRDVDQGDYDVRLEAGQVRTANGVAFPSASIAYAQWLRFEPSAIDVRRLVVAGEATLSCTPADIGSVDNLFDQDLTTLYRTSSANPASVEITFQQPQTFRGFRFYGAGATTPPAFRLNIETANTPEDLQNRSGSYRQVYAAAPVANRTVTQLFPASPVVARIIRLRATQVGGDGVIHLYDWTLLGPIPTDISPPLAGLLANDIERSGDTGNYLQVDYTDEGSIRLSSLGAGNLVVSGPNGYSEPAVLASLDLWQDGPARRARYWIPAPGGVWDSTDNGLYTVTLLAGQVCDRVGNSHTQPLALGAFRVAAPQPVRRPPCDLAETNAQSWLAGADGATATTHDDPTGHLLGSTSIRFDTDGGFDTWLRFPQPFGADWDLTTANNLYFSIYAENDNSPQFQENSPWIRLRDNNGGYFEYRYYQNGSRIDPLNGALGKWVAFTVPLRAGDTVANGWRRTVSAAPRLDHISSFEFHADTWGAGFHFWLDRVGFDLPVQVVGAVFEVVAGAAQLRIRFDESVQATLATSDLSLLDTNTGRPVSTSALALAYDATSNTARIGFPGLPAALLPVGNYRLTIPVAAIADPAGNRMRTDFVYTFQVVLDSDGDGMPDAWERSYNLDPFSPADAIADPDGDSLPNRAEYQSGTNPRDVSSRLAVTSFACGPGLIAIVWSCVPEKQYRIQVSANLRDWEPVAVDGDPVLVAGNSTGTARLELPVQGPAADPRFYRIELAQP
jgi:hypothetical protein